jgi:hypothetical protein
MVNHYLKRIIPLLIFCAAATASYAQTTISGKVIDATSGEPLIGVNVVVKGKVIGKLYLGHVIKINEQMLGFILNMDVFELHYLI